MSRERRHLPSSATDRDAGTARGSDRDVERDAQARLGNQALTARITGPDTGEHPLAVARDVALPLVDRGGLALQITPHGTDAMARFREILGNSLLPGERRDGLLARLDADEAVARDVSDAVRASFGGDDDDDTRDAASRALDRVADALRGGSPGDAGWHLPDGRVAPVATEGNRATALIAAVADHVADAPGSGSSGARILAFCQRANLALLLEEEEEEPTGPDYGPELE